MSPARTSQDRRQEDKDHRSLSLVQPEMRGPSYLYARTGLPASAGDPRLFKIIILQEFGDSLNLEVFNRGLMLDMERDLGMPLEWVATIHRNTEYPYVHVALRSARARWSAVGLSHSRVWKLPANPGT